MEIEDETGFITVLIHNENHSLFEMAESIVKDEVVDKFINEAGLNYKQKTGVTASFYIAEVSDGPRELISETI